MDNTDIHAFSLDTLSYMQLKQLLGDVIAKLNKREQEKGQKEWDEVRKSIENFLDIGGNIYYIDATTGELHSNHGGQVNTSEVGTIIF